MLICLLLSVTTLSFYDSRASHCRETIWPTRLVFVLCLFCVEDRQILKMTMSYRKLNQAGSIFSFCPRHGFFTGADIL